MKITNTYGIWKAEVWRYKFVMLKNLGLDGVEWAGIVSRLDPAGECSLLGRAKKGTRAALLTALVDMAKAAEQPSGIFVAWMQEGDPSVTAELPAVAEVA